MNKTTLKALRGSIKKWELIVAGKGVDLRSSNCPLCELYVIEQGTCKGCPVAEHTGKPFCRATPYEKWAEQQELSENDCDPWEADTPKRLSAARAELRFLKSLLP